MFRLLQMVLGTCSFIILIPTGTHLRLFRMDKKFYRPSTIEKWVVVVYERQQRFDQRTAAEMVAGLVRSCKDCGQRLCRCLTSDVLIQRGRYYCQG